MKKLIFLVLLITITAPVSVRAFTTEDCQKSYGTTDIVVSPDGKSCIKPDVTAGNAQLKADVSCPGGGKMVNGACNLGYTPLEPIPGFTVGTNLADPNNLPGLINLIFKILITVGALIAVLSLTIGGIQYMVSEVVQRKASALNRVRSSLWAILLIASVWLILNTVNPDLLKFTFSPCKGTGCVVNSSPNNNLNTSNTPSLTSGTIDPNSSQGKALQEELCAAASYLSTCYGSGKYITYNSTNQNNQAVKDFIAQCESWNTSYVYFSKAITFSGDKVGAPGNTGVSCVSPLLP
jgi:hypothetical protein